MRLREQDRVPDIGATTVDGECHTRAGDNDRNDDSNHDANDNRDDD